LWVQAQRHPGGGAGWISCFAPLRTYVRDIGGDWRQGFEYAWQQPNSEPDEGPGLTWRQLAPRHWSGTWETKIRGTVTATLKAGSPTCASRTGPASHPSPPSAGRHRRRCTGGDRRGVGGEVTHSDRQIWAIIPSSGPPPAGSGYAQGWPGGSAGVRGRKVASSAPSRLSNSA
jgi:hypothetical protein